MTEGLAPIPPPRRPGLRWLGARTRAQRWLWLEALCAWTGRPRPSDTYASRLGDGRRFALRRGPWLGTLVPLVVLAQFVDVLVCQGALHVAAPRAWRWPLHGLLLAVSVWSVAWAVALRSAMHRISHVLRPDALTLAVGFRHLCHLPLAAIEDVRVIDHRAARQGQDWLDVHDLKPREVMSLAAIDRPTLLIVLRPGAPGAWRTLDGVPGTLRRHVAVVVDEPALMAAAIAAARVG